MNYYQFHIGDYAAHTSRLSLMEDLAYRRMLDAYYLAERPLVGSSTDVAREIGMSEHIQAVEYVLNRFFVRSGSEWVSGRCDTEISRYQSKQAQASLAGKASAAKRTSNASSTPVEKNPTDVQPTNNQEPIVLDKPNGLSVASVETTTAERIDNCPHDLVLGLYAKTLPTLPQPLKSRWASSKGAVQLRMRWREDKKHQDPEFWEWFFSTVATNPHWMGRNDRNWTADLHWLLKRENFDKVLARGLSL